jgi:hypothetical protein
LSAHRIRCHGAGLPRILLMGHSACCRSFCLSLTDDRTTGRRAFGLME